MHQVSLQLTYRKFPLVPVLPVYRSLRELRIGGHSGSVSTYRYVPKWVAAILAYRLSQASRSAKCLEASTLSDPPDPPDPISSGKSSLARIVTSPRRLLLDEGVKSVSREPRVSTEIVGRPLSADTRRGQKINRRKREYRPRKYPAVEDEA